MRNQKSWSRKAVYNLSFIVSETGIKADTLRAWERRYKLPLPERTKGGHRLYSDFDIQIVKWLQSKQNEGMSISKAVKLWNENILEGLTILEQPRTINEVPNSPFDESNRPHSTKYYRQLWIRACLNFDELEAERVISEAFGFFDIAAVCIEILKDGLVEIGNLWYLGRATVQQEHFASGLAVRRINALIAANPGEVREERVVVATPPNEEHVLSSLILTLLLRLRGLRVTYLGANVPQEGLEIMLKIINPALVIMTSTHLRSIPGLFEIANYLAKDGTSFCFGGRIFSEYEVLRDKIPGHYLGNNLKNSLESIEKMLDPNSKKLPNLFVNKHAQKSLKVFSKHKPAIEAKVAEFLQIPNGSLEFQHQFTSDNIEASLVSGLDEPLVGELNWAIEFIKINEPSAPKMIEYLNAYKQVSKKEIGEPDGLVQKWLLRAVELV
jgi:DNA-binding transcriptional MerR regulator/methanogenic corrinoid protein MtbC1